MEKEEIISVEKGWGEDSVFYSTTPTVGQNHYVTDIKEETKQVGDDALISVYCGYLHGKKIFQMGISRDVTVVFK